MNLSKPWNSAFRFFFQSWLKVRCLLPRHRSNSFASESEKQTTRIQKIYVINLDRQSGRWARVQQELKRILDASGADLLGITERHSAVDGSAFINEPSSDADIDIFYTLEDQLFVEPQPHALPAQFELRQPIQMSRPEVAVARSHIDVWRKVSQSNQDYSLILEDDIWIHPWFQTHLDGAWKEINSEVSEGHAFDVLYLSYVEVKGGAPKTIVSSNLFRPERGLWNLSGYILSKRGATKLLSRLPCCGPVDLWLNHQFETLNVFATRQSLISQRRDTASTNSYSILPALTSIGAITSEAASLFNIRPACQPVFAFGNVGSGATSLAMALSMLGYSCCSDIRNLPEPELDNLLSGRSERIFNAYVNVGTLVDHVQLLQDRYPAAKFIIAGSEAQAEKMQNAIGNIVETSKLVVLDLQADDRWTALCEHLRCSPPPCEFPVLKDLGQREILTQSAEIEQETPCRHPKRDASPWIITPPENWSGIRACPSEVSVISSSDTSTVYDTMDSLNDAHWHLQTDTFTDNLALFRPSNVEFKHGMGARLWIRKEELGVRDYSAASLCSKSSFLFGRFEADIKASNVPGVLTGFFLHRNSPRQEIDIEIAGGKPDRLIVNVFYNPGGPGAKFDYGYRGSPSYIDLGFDASTAFHRFAIEWTSTEIRWFVDDHLVHRRAEWDPTPIPQLPLKLHINSWITRSAELAGRLNSRNLPASTMLQSVSLNPDYSPRT